METEEQKDEFIISRRDIKPKYFQPKDFESIVWGTNKHPQEAIAELVNQKVSELFNRMQKSVQIKETCKDHKPKFMYGSPEQGVFKCSECDTPLRAVFVEAKSGNA